MTEPVRVRDAATVVLLRDGAAGLETWLLSRVARLEFAPSVAVFPGGAVDATDGELPWSGPEPEDVAAAFGCSLAMARALVGAAVREVFEETGVLLTDPPGDLAAAQPDVEAGRTTFADLLVSHGLRIAAGTVRAWAHWTTPVGETTRRYDTRFFVAGLPADSVAADLTTESSTAAWVPVRQVQHDRAEGKLVLMPPTISVLDSIAPFDTVADVLTAAVGRDVPSITPVIRLLDGRKHVELPDGTTIVM